VAPFLLLLTVEYPTGEPLFQVSTKNGISPLNFNSATIIRHIPTESKRNLNLQFADFIAHIVWSRYENNQYEPCKILKPFILEKHLFF
jgi:hypothetical protein